jgi:hypothetical protein
MKEDESNSLRVVLYQSVVNVLTSCSSGMVLESFLRLCLHATAASWVLMSPSDKKV